MMFTESDLSVLIGPQQGPCVSLFLPTHRGTKEVQQDPIRFKNLLRRAETILVSKGMSVEEVKCMFRPADTLLRDPLFWQQQSDGLAVFLSSGEFQPFRVPWNFEEMLDVDEQFHVRPLLPILTQDGRFYILALSQNEVRLLQGTHYGVSEVHLETMPASLKEALMYDDPQKPLQWHSPGPKGKGRRGAMLHGQGAGADGSKDGILRYFQQIDAALQPFLGQGPSPLVLAGVDYLFGIYRKANHYAHLMDRGVVGNPEPLSAEQLRSRAWEIVEPHFQEARKKALARYDQLADTPRASHDPKEIAAAASQGRVQVLFVARNTHQWGHFDIDTQRARLERSQKSGAVDLLDLCTREVLLKGDQVYVLAPEEVPEGGSLAAIYRY
jgi:hypothetical protein